MYRNFSTPLLSLSLAISAALAPAAPIFAAESSSSPTAATSNPMETPASLVYNFTGLGKELSPTFFGMRDDTGVFPCYSQSPAFKQGLSYLGNKIFRVMQMSMTCASNYSSNTITAASSSSWIDFSTHKWDEQKIKTTLDSIPEGASIMIGIPKWPYWMNDMSIKKTDAMGRLDLKQKANYANLCAELVYIVNVKMHRNVTYWEPMNECDGYFTSGSSSQTINGARVWAPASLDVKNFSDVYNQCARAMRLVDGNIKIGGPAFAYGDVATANGWVKSFVAATAPNLDFFSAHFYPSHNDKESNDTVLNYPLSGQTGTYPYSQQQFWLSTTSQVKEGCPTKYIPTFIDEFNINSSTSPFEPRQQTTVGAVFDALMYVAATRSHLAGLHAHDSVGPNFGKFDLPNMWFFPKVSKEIIYPGGVLQHLLTHHFIGHMAYTQSSNEKLIVPLAVKTSSGKSLLLANRSGSTVHLSLYSSSSGGFSGKIDATMLSSDSKNNPTQALTTMTSTQLAKSGLTIPPYSVAVLLGR